MTTEQPKMEYNFLGNSGVKISNICLGTMTFGTVDPSQPMSYFFNNPTQLQEADAHKILDRFVELGGNFLDTANIYASGNSEKIIGTWLKKQKRDDLIIATKCRFPTSWGFGVQNAVGLSRRNILQACNESLARLQTDYIDLYQAHMWDDATPLEETLRAFNDLIRMGKIRYYGFSNVCGWQMQKIVDTAARLNLEPCVTLQQQYSLLRRQSEWEEFMVCENDGIAVLPWSPLKGGMLAGKFKRGEVPDAKSSRTGHLKAMQKEGKTQQSTWDELGDDDQYWNLIDLMRKIANNHGKTVAQVALRWLIQRKVVASVIIGATSVKQLEDNVGAAAGWALTDEEMTQLCDASPKTKVYPYDMIWGMGQTSRKNPFKK